MNVRNAYFFREINLGIIKGKNEAKIFFSSNKWVAFTRFVVKKEKNHFLKRMDISKKRPLFCLVNIAHFSIIRKEPCSFWYKKKDKNGYYYISWRLVAAAFDKRGSKGQFASPTRYLKISSKYFPIRCYAGKIVSYHIFCYLRAKNLISLC